MCCGQGGLRSGFPFGLMCATCLGILVFYYQFLLGYSSVLFNVTWIFSMSLMFVALYFVKRDPGKFVNADSVFVADLVKSYCPFCMLAIHLDRVHHCRKCEHCITRFDQ
jgi:hypothetical protein